MASASLKATTNRTGLLFSFSRFQSLRCRAKLMYCQMPISLRLGITGEKLFVAGSDDEIMGVEKGRGRSGVADMKRVG